MSKELSFISICTRLAVTAGTVRLSEEVNSGGIFVNSKVEMFVNSRESRDVCKQQTCNLSIHFCFPFLH